MPGGDGTGPWGMGSMTGRAAGFCTGYAAPGRANPGFGRWFRPWCGGGRGWRNMYYATGLPGWVRAGYAPAPAGPYQGFTPEQQADLLREQAKTLSDQIAAINARIAELERKE